jgi:hypothetical protein
MSNILSPVYADFFNGEVIGKKKFLRDYSKGNQKKVGIVGTFLGAPDCDYSGRAVCQPRSQFAVQTPEADKRSCGTVRNNFSDIRPYARKYCRCEQPIVILEKRESGERRAEIDNNASGNRGLLQAVAEPDLV